MWSKADGQLTQVAHLCLRWFFERTGTDVQNIGILLRLKSGRQIRIFLRLGVVAGDEPGIKEVLSCKGHGGAKPCVMCQNCVLHTHVGAEASGFGLHLYDERVVSIAETDVTKFMPCT